MTESAAIASTLRERLFRSRGFERFLEMVPGILTWSALIAPFPLSFFAPTAVAYFIITFDLFMLVLWTNVSLALITGYRRLRLAASFDWLWILQNMEDPVAFHHRLEEENFTQQQKKFLLAEASRVATEPDPIFWRDVHHLIIVATYNEKLEILESTVRALAESNFPVREKVVVVYAAEERGLETAKKSSQYLAGKYGDSFSQFIVSIHPDNLPDEGKAKGANISYAGKIAKEYFDAAGIDLARVITTVLDADTVVDRQFLAHLTYYFATSSERKHLTFQPIPLFYNNILDAPAISRIIATGSSFWQIIESTRPHRLRNFSSHAMTLSTLVEIGWWDKFSINDDSRQFWRAYFAYHGRHKVLPLWVPVYNDAVLSENLPKTLRSQYHQLQRWAYGVSEFPFVVRHFVRDHEISFTEKAAQIARLLEGHFTWATAPLFMTFVAWLPIIFNNDFRNDVLVYTLPNVTSLILTLGLVGLFITIWVSLALLPKKKTAISFKKQIGFVVQWVLMPATTILFSSLPAIDAQTRLMLGKYMGFRVTEKARRQEIEFASPL